VRGDFAQSIQDFIKYRISADQHVVIPKSDHPEAQRLQGGGAFLVVFRIFEVLTTIQLNDNSRRKADKVHNIIGQLVLTSKFPTFKTSAA